jgi:hypothetical protein
VYDFRAQLWALDEQPDPNDGATKGALLEVVRELWGGTIWIGGRFIRPGRIAWWVFGPCDEDAARINGIEGFDSEFAALEAARVAAP